MDDSERLFWGGNRDPRFGFSVRQNSGAGPDVASIARAGALLGRDPFFIDQRGYECELIAAAIHPSGDRVAYVESRARKRWWSSLVDVSIKIHLVEPDMNEQSTDIQSYNPFFGCDVGFFDWFEDTALLVYTEKHNTYACKFGSEWPPRFTEIEDRWTIHEGVLAYIGYKQESVKRLTIPDLAILESISIEEAERLGLSFVENE